MKEIIIKTTEMGVSAMGNPYSETREQRYELNEGQYRKIMDILTGTEEMRTYEALLEYVPEYCKTNYGLRDSVIGVLMEKEKFVPLSVVKTIQRFYNGAAKDYDIAAALKNGEIDGVIPESTMVMVWNGDKGEKVPRKQMKESYKISVESLVRWLDKHQKRKALPKEIELGLNRYLI